MQISVTFRHMDSREELKDYVYEKFRRLKKYVDFPVDIQVVLTQEKHRHIAEAALKGNGLFLTGQEETGDMFSSIDAVLDKLERQVKKQKEKVIRQKYGDDERARRFRFNVISGEEPEETREPRIIRSNNYYAKPMSLEEAVMQLKLMNEEFLVFTDSTTNNISVLYKRKDGNFGLIQPE